MTFNVRLTLVAALALAAAGFPLANVSAHTCTSSIAQAPSNPNDADTGCNGAACPSDSGTLPHDHQNTVPPTSCQNYGPPPSGGCEPNKHGKGKGHGDKGGNPSPAPATPEAAAAEGLGGPVLALCHNAPGAPDALAALSYCPHPVPHSHSFGSGGSAAGRSDTVTGGDEVGGGAVTVSETNFEDCDGDGVPGDYDGDWETGVGGGFFGYGPWGNEPTCNYGLTLHGGTVYVHDLVYGWDISFVIGADDTSGPVVSVDPVTGETTCETDGTITPGDPTTDPTADADDCLTEVFIGSGYTCGAGGDGGYWVFLYGTAVSEGPWGVGLSNPPTAGIITA